MKINKVSYIKILRNKLYKVRKKILTILRVRLVEEKRGRKENFGWILEGKIFIWLFDKDEKREGKNKWDPQIFILAMLEGKVSGRFF